MKSSIASSSSGDEHKITNPNDGSPLNMSSWKTVYFQ